MSHVVWGEYYCIVTLIKRISTDKYTVGQYDLATVYINYFSIFIQKNEMFSCKLHYIVLVEHWVCTC